MPWPTVERTESLEDLLEALMGRKPELRFRFTQESAEFAVAELDVWGRAHFGAFGRPAGDFWRILAYCWRAFGA